MKWTVVWMDAPLADLARHFAPLWGTPAGQAVTRAMAEIDRRLASDPSEEGESREGHRRILFEPPLTADIEVHDEPRIVIVTRLRYAPPKGM